MNNKNTNVIYFTDAVYGQDFMFVFAKSQDKFCEIVKEELNIELGNAQADGEFCVLPVSRKHKSIAVIWSSNKQSSLIHECLHACSYVLRNRNILLSSIEAEEAYAYYLSYIWRTIKEKIKLVN